MLKLAGFPAVACVTKRTRLPCSAHLGRVHQQQPHQAQHHASGARAAGARLRQRELYREGVGVGVRRWSWGDGSPRVGP